MKSTEIINATSASTTDRAVASYIDVYDDSKCSQTEAKLSAIRYNHNRAAGQRRVDE